MQTFDLEQFTNSSNWHIIHDLHGQLYKIVNEKGNSLPTTFTMRSYAEVELYKYLTKVESIKSPGRKGNQKGS
jgi:hypothetical protein|tara:strand:- start:4262 stop:4480 length:219 start_codon:yes stop_codon:yes gene_type:complete